MPARSIGSGTISFGLVTIPVKLFSASESAASISFNMLHAKCHSRLKQQYLCSKDGEVVGRDETVKGYEYAKDQYVVFTEDELKAMLEDPNRAIEIEEFVAASEVDPIYFEGAYYLGPDKGAEKSYKLLGEAMKRTGRSALARWSARGKQYLVLLRAIEGGIVMQQLRYQEEVRPVSEVPIGDAEVKEVEIGLALQLIEQIATDEFHPERYEDGQKKAIRAAIERKIEGKEVTEAPEAPRGQIIDLMEALKASLAQRAGRPGPKAAAAASGSDRPTDASVEAPRRPAKRVSRAAQEDDEAKPVRGPRRAASGGGGGE